MEMHIKLDDDQRNFLRKALARHIEDHMPSEFDPMGGDDWREKHRDWTWLNQFKEDLFMFDYRPGAVGWKNIKKLDP